MITIKELADLAGVSPTTVSNVINGRPGKMSCETLEKVRSVIRENNYISNMGARMLASYGSKIISVIVCFSIRQDFNVMNDSFFGEIIGELEYEIRGQGYYMMLYIARDIDECVRASLSWNSEGIIMVGCPLCECKRLYEQIHEPLTFIDSYFTDDEHDYINVGLADYQGAYDMTRYLIEQGHRSIAFMVNGDHPEGVDLERLKGFKAALKDYKIPFRDKNFVPFSYEFDRFSYEMEQFVKEHIGDYSALFFTADQFAVHCMNIFSYRGVRIPDDISIVGFDNSAMSQRCRPMLTTVSQSVNQKAKYAVLQTICQIRKQKPEISRIILPTSLIIRDSVKCMCE